MPEDICMALDDDDDSPRCTRCNIEVPGLLTLPCGCTGAVCGECFVQYGCDKFANKNAKKVEHLRRKWRNGASQAVDQEWRGIKIGDRALEQEMRKSRDSVKLARQMERNYKDMEYQYNQERRNYEKMEAGTNFSPILFHFLLTFARI